MPRPKKIKKKKSFMFTTRHYSFTGILSLFLALFSFVSFAGAVLVSYYSKGNVDIHFGGVGLFALLSNLTGIAAALVSLKERDIYTWMPNTALALNITDIVIWILIIIWGA
ncbi:MAG: hypothetical protein K5931_03625 [Lachnospiraceae bacterium]|nr:hypothetical protein [Lachnospiraceae bacterium]